MALGPRVRRVRVGPRCDDECPDCPGSGMSPLTHALIVAGATVAFQALGEIVVKRMTASAEFIDLIRERMSEAPVEEPTPPPSRKRGAK